MISLSVLYFIFSEPSTPLAIKQVQFYMTPFFTSISLSLRLTLMV